MTAETMIEKPTATDKKRKRLTLEEQIARQEELLAKDKESLAKKQQRLRSLNASKMNKDRKEAQKKRNAMLIQLGLLFINNINWMETEEGRDIKLEAIDYYIELVEERINYEEEEFNKKYGDDRSTKDAKAARKSVYDKYIMRNTLKNMKENYLKIGKAKIQLYKIIFYQNNIIIYN